MFKRHGKKLFFVSLFTAFILSLPVSPSAADTTITSMQIEEAPQIQVDTYTTPTLEPQYEPYVPPSPTVTLMVGTYIVTGNATGTIRIEPQGIECRVPSTCQQTFNRGEHVTLRAIPDAGAFFPGWDVRFRDDAGAFLNLPRVCTDGADTCELTLDYNVVVSGPLFLPDISADLAVQSLTATPKDVPLGTPVALSTKIKNLGIDTSLNAQVSLGVTQITRTFDPVTNNASTNVWSWGYNWYGAGLAPGAEDVKTATSTPLPREGKYIVKSQVATTVDKNKDNNVMADAVYVTAQAKAVLQGNILQLPLGKIRSIKPAVLILSGPENRQIKLPSNARTYSFSNLRLGKYTLTLLSKDYQPVRHTFEILAGNAVKKIDIGLKEKKDRVNRPPVAAAAISPETGNDRQIFTLDASSSFDPDRDPLRYLWDLGDGFTYLEGRTVQSRLWSIGANTVTLTVIDPLGASTTSTLTVNVTSSRPVGDGTRIPVDDIGEQYLPLPSPTPTPSLSPTPLP